MIFQETSLKGAYLIDLEPFEDERGMFARTFCKKEFAKIDHHKEFVQFNHSITHEAGTLRGMHFQYPPHAEIKLIRCVKGIVLDVIIDIRKHSPTFLQHIKVELSALNKTMIYVPEGFAHGFQTLEDNTELIYHHTAYYAPDHEGGINYADPMIEVQWPLTPKHLTEKDRNYPFLAKEFEGVDVNQKYTLRSI